jgi:hypothetical protein
MTQDFVAKMIGRKLDIYCGGGSSLRGEVIKVEDGVLHLQDAENKMCYVAVEKIVVVWEALDDHRAGFVASSPGNK